MEKTSASSSSFLLFLRDWKLKEINPGGVDPLEEGWINLEKGCLPCCLLGKHLVWEDRGQGHGKNLASQAH